MRASEGFRLEAVSFRVMFVTSDGNNNALGTESHGKIYINAF